MLRVRRRKARNWSYLHWSQEMIYNECQSNDRHTRDVEDPILRKDKLLTKWTLFKTRTTLKFLKQRSNFWRCMWEHMKNQNKQTLRSRFDQVLEYKLQLARSSLRGDNIDVIPPARHIIGKTAARQLFLYFAWWSDFGWYQEITASPHNTSSSLEN